MQGRQNTREGSQRMLDWRQVTPTAAQDCLQVTPTIKRLPSGTQYLDIIQWNFDTEPTPWNNYKKTCGTLHRLRRTKWAQGPATMCPLDPSAPRTQASIITLGEHVQSEGQSSQTEKSENPDFASCKQHPILPCTALVKPIVDQLGNLAAQQVWYAAVWTP